MRHAIETCTVDKGKAPKSLAALVEAGYLESIPRIPSPRSHPHDPIPTIPSPRSHPHEKVTPSPHKKVWLRSKALSLPARRYVKYILSDHPRAFA
jgi:hypothetical protein